MRRRSLRDLIRYTVSKETRRSGLEVKRGTVTGYRPTGSTGGSYSVQMPGGEGSGISCPSGAHDLNGSVMCVRVPGSSVNTIMLGAPSALQTNAALQFLSLDVTNEVLL